MTDRDKEHSSNPKDPNGNLEESISSGRITQAEAEVIKLFLRAGHRGIGLRLISSGGCRVRAVEPIFATAAQLGFRTRPFLQLLECRSLESLGLHTIFDVGPNASRVQIRQRYIQTLEA